jgi:hypothetical protein
MKGLGNVIDGIDDPDIVWSRVPVHTSVSFQPILRSARLAIKRRRPSHGAGKPLDQPILPTESAVCRLEFYGQETKHGEETGVGG